MVGGDGPDAGSHSRSWRGGPRARYRQRQAIAPRRAGFHPRGWVLGHAGRTERICPLCNLSMTLIERTPSLWPCAGCRIGVDVDQPSIDST